MPELILIGDGRLARHLTRYFEQLGLRWVAWSRRAEARGECPALAGLVQEWISRHSAEPGTQPRALLALRDSAIEPFIAENPILQNCVRVHFSGRLSTPLAYGAHPLFSFADTIQEEAIYRRIPFILDRGSPPLSALVPGLPNPFHFIDPEKRPRYHALCVLAGNFTTLLWRKFFYELEREFDLPRGQALPYLDSVLSALAGPGAPLSGPLSRGDEATIAENLRALKEDPFEEVYRAFVSAFERQGRLAKEQHGKDWLASP